MTHLISHYGYTYTDYHIEYSYPCNLASLASYINQPKLPLACQYPDQEILTIIDDCPPFNSEIQVYHSAVATFYAPSDLCGAGGMWHEWIWSTPSFMDTHNMLLSLLFSMTLSTAWNRWKSLTSFFLFTSAKKYFLVHWSTGLFTVTSLIETQECGLLSLSV